jgi:glucokinase
VIVLVGDLGGTNSRLALYDGEEPIFERTYPSAELTSLEEAAKKFLAEAGSALGARGRPERACFAVAGPVANGQARITNLSWSVDEKRLVAETGLPRVKLVNDFEAAASGVARVGPDHLIPVGGGAAVAGGPAVVAGPGTGLGQAFLFWSAAAGRYEVHASEGGHSDFAPTSALERGLAATLAARHGHVSVERVLSGPGLRDIFGYLLDQPPGRRLAAPETIAAMAKEDGAAVIVRQALAGRDPLCLMAVHLFLSVLGAHTGNLALAVLASGGVYIAGGITPRLAPLLAGSPLRESFEAKGRMQPLLAGIPMFVVTHREVGLLGAATLAVRD